ncbi:hypothetical protein CHISP_2942 [Chitinispirillum alkaliphilum]|nr:hypothetical protein CHISP_2942 [Chitinispirillum alkaliphilum]
MYTTQRNVSQKVENSINFTIYVKEPHSEGYRIYSKLDSVAMDLPTILGGTRRINTAWDLDTMDNDIYDEKYLFTVFFKTLTQTPFTMLMDEQLNIISVEEQDSFKEQFIEKLKSNLELNCSEGKKFVSDLVHSVFDNEEIFDLFKTPQSSNFKGKVRLNEVWESSVEEKIGDLSLTVTAQNRLIEASLSTVLIEVNGTVEQKASSESSSYGTRISGTQHGRFRIGVNHGFPIAAEIFQYLDVQDGSNRRSNLKNIIQVNIQRRNNNNTSSTFRTDCPLLKKSYNFFGNRFPVMALVDIDSQRYSIYEAFADINRNAFSLNPQTAPILKKKGMSLIMQTRDSSNFALENNINRFVMPETQNYLLYKFQNSSAFRIWSHKFSSHELLRIDELYHRMINPVLLNPRFYTVHYAVPNLRAIGILNDTSINGFDTPGTGKWFASMNSERNFNKFENAGINLSYLELIFDTGEIGGIYEPERMRRVEMFVEKIKTHPTVNHVFSGVDLLRWASEALYGCSHAADSKTSISQALIKLALATMDNTNGDYYYNNTRYYYHTWYNQWISPGAKAMRLVIYLNTCEDEEIAALMKECRLLWENRAF